VPISRRRTRKINNNNTYIQGDLKKIVSSTVYVIILKIEIFAEKKQRAKGHVVGRRLTAKFRTCKRFLSADTPPPLPDILPEERVASSSFAVTCPRLVRSMLH